MAGDPQQLRTPRRKQEEGLRAIREPVPVFSDARSQGEIRAASTSFWKVREFPGVSIPFVRRVEYPAGKGSILAARSPPCERPESAQRCRSDVRSRTSELLPDSGHC